jgi:hypothetical protein
MARCKTDMLSGLIRKSPPASAGAFRAGRLAPFFPPGQAPPQRGFCPGGRPYGPAAKEGDNNFPLWQRGNKGDFVNCRSSINFDIRIAKCGIKFENQDFLKWLEYGK